MISNSDRHRSISSPTGGDFPRERRHFWWLFRKKKKKTNGAVRPGAMSSEALTAKIKALGEGKVVEITRIGFDGQVEDKPITIEITGIYPDRFSGRIVNVERELIESSASKMVYAKTGGGTVEFRYNDGDIHEIKESEDLAILEEARDVAALSDILTALEPGDRILISYYDAKHHGSVNAEGSILETSPENKTFKLELEQINHMELEQKIVKEFNVEKDLVIDIELI